MSKKYPACPHCGSMAVYKMNVCATWDIDSQRWKLVTREPDDLRFEDEYACATCHPEPSMGCMGSVTWMKVY